MMISVKKFKKKIEKKCKDVPFRIIFFTKHDARQDAGGVRSLKNRKANTAQCEGRVHELFVSARAHCIRGCRDVCM